MRQWKINNRAERLTTENPFVYLGRGMTYYRMKRYEEALSDFDQAFSVNDNDQWPVLLERGRTFAKLKRYDDAIRDLDIAVSQSRSTNTLLARAGLQRYRAV
jgi:tetratricopeptide (TPR) repeat protein